MTDPLTVPSTPHLRGERVWLRRLEERDLEAYVAGVNDLEVGGWAGYRGPTTVEAARAWLAKVQQRDAANEQYTFTVCELGSDGFVGTAWLKEVNWVDRNAELAIFMDRAHQGSGWGSDAQRALLDWAFGGLGLARVYLFTDAFNARAIRSYEKVGFTLEGTLRQNRQYRGELTDTLIMAILRADWDADARARSWDR
jgi:RimJ/RimL family protein N-acetyltransferase